MDLSGVADALLHASTLNSEAIMSTLHLSTEPTVTPTVTRIAPPVNAVNSTNTTELMAQILCH